MTSLFTKMQSLLRKNAEVVKCQTEERWQNQGRMPSATKSRN